jgi:hypothetical protein
VTHFMLVRKLRTRKFRNFFSKALKKLFIVTLDDVLNLFLRS